MKTHPVERILNLLALPLAAYALVTLLTACAWSVPADPGLHAQRRADRGATARDEPASAPAGRRAEADDPTARRLYLQHCGRCHEAWPRTHVTAAQWPRFVRIYAPRAGLFGADRQRVLRWLQAGAR